MGAGRTNGLGDLLGRRIIGVMLTCGTRPYERIHLAFDDNTYYEFYSGDRLNSGNRVYAGGEADVRRATREDIVVFESWARPPLPDIQGDLLEALKSRPNKSVSGKSIDDI